MQSKVAVLILSLGLAIVANGQLWDGLRISWNPNPFSNYAFTALPRTVSDAAKAGFILKDSYCGNDLTFRGIRYWSNSDPAVILLYDINGYIAGMQSGALKTKYAPSTNNMGKTFISDGDYYTLTAYFVDPNIICSPGRNLNQFTDQGTGDRLLFQTGPDPTQKENTLWVPQDQALAPSSNWNKSKCVPTMGVHYFYETKVDMDCGMFFPFFIMYNSAKLTAFAFVINADLGSPRYDIMCPQKGSDFGSFVSQPPVSCFSTDPGYAKIDTMHTYMIDNPRTGSLC